MTAPNYNATGRSKTLIAQLCMALKIREPLEERPMTQGEAGKIIRQLGALVTAERREKRAQSRNPTRGT